MKRMEPGLRVGDSGIHGRGLFATEAIQKGTVLGSCRTRKTKIESEYTLWVDKGPVDVVCRLKYINHSATPNVAYYSDLSVVALKNIKAGQELTHNYGKDWQ